MNYTKMADTARKLIAKYGVHATILRVVEGTYDHVTDTLTASPQSFPASILLKNPRKRDIDGTRIKAGDMFAVLSPSGCTFEPESGHTVSIAGKEWSVVSVEAASPANVPITYTLQLRS